MEKVTSKLNYSSEQTKTVQGVFDKAVNKIKDKKFVIKDLKDLFAAYNEHITQYMNEYDKQKIESLTDRFLNEGRPSVERPFNFEETENKYNTQKLEIEKTLSSQQKND